MNDLRARCEVGLTVLAVFSDANCPQSVCIGTYSCWFAHCRRQRCSSSCMQCNPTDKQIGSQGSFKATKIDKYISHTRKSQHHELHTNVTLVREAVLNTQRLSSAGQESYWVHDMGLAFKLNGSCEDILRCVYDEAVQPHWAQNLIRPWECSTPKSQQYLILQNRLPKCVTFARGLSRFLNCGFR